MYSSPNCFRAIESTIMRLEGPVARMGERRGAYSVLVQKRQGKRPLRRLGIKGRIILKWVFKNWVRGHGLDGSD